MLREIIFDTETTGLSAAEDRIVEIGAVEIVDLLPTGKTFHAYVNPMREVPIGAFKIHGLSYEFLKTKPTFKRVARKFLDFIGDARLVAHNGNFDMKFINAELERMGEPKLQNELVDTLALAREVKKGGRHTLDDLCKHFRVDNTKRHKHGALVDSEILAKVYLELRGGRQFGMMLPVDAKANDNEKPSYGERPIRSRITAAELAAHTAFVESLGPTSVWAKWNAEEVVAEAA